jgi:hypothetical protein
MERHKPAKDAIAIIRKPIRRKAVSKAMAEGCVNVTKTIRVPRKVRTASGRVTAFLMCRLTVFSNGTASQLRLDEARLGPTSPDRRNLASWRQAPYSLCRRRRLLTLRSRDRSLKTGRKSSSFSQRIVREAAFLADVAKQVDARDLKSFAARHAGSIPAVRTILSTNLDRPPDKADRRNSLIRPAWPSCGRRVARRSRRARESRQA